MSAHHIVPVRVYLTVIAALLVLTVVTVWVAFFDFGYLNTVVAVGIACFKALLVVMFFMHLKYSARVLWLYAGAGAVFFLIMIALTLSDYRSRNWFPQAESWETRVEQPASAH